MTDLDVAALRRAIPEVVGILVRRGADFASAEDAVQSALVRALERAGHDDVRDMRAWLVTVAWRAFLDQVRSDAARTARQDRLAAEPEPGLVPQRDDTLAMYFLCTHPSLTSASAVALTLRAVAGLTTRQIADAFLVPEATMGQRISRAKQRLAGVSLDQPGDLSRVLRVPYVLFTEGYSGEIDLAAEAIRVTRQLAALTDEPEARGLLALMLLSHARRPARVVDGRLVPLAEQDRSLWNAAAMSDGIDIRPGGARARPAGAVPGAGRDRSTARRCTHRRSDRLGADRGVVRRAARPGGLRRHPGRPRRRGR